MDNRIKFSNMDNDKLNEVVGGNFVDLSNGIVDSEKLEQAQQNLRENLELNGLVAGLTNQIASTTSQILGTIIQGKQQALIYGTKK